MAKTGYSLARRPWQLAKHLRQIHLLDGSFSELDKRFLLLVRPLWFHRPCELCAVYQKQLEICERRWGRSQDFSPFKRRQTFLSSLDFSLHKVLLSLLFFFDRTSSKFHSSGHIRFSSRYQNLPIFQIINPSLAPDKRCLASCFSVTSKLCLLFHTRQLLRKHSSILGLN